MPHNCFPLLGARGAGDDIGLQRVLGDDCGGGLVRQSPSFDSRAPSCGHGLDDEDGDFHAGDLALCEVTSVVWPAQVGYRRLGLVEGARRVRVGQGVDVFAEVRADGGRNGAAWQIHVHPVLDNAANDACVRGHALLRLHDPVEDAVGLSVLETERCAGLCASLR